jgi:hypothetical protein
MSKRNRNGRRDENAAERPAEGLPPAIADAPAGAVAVAVAVELYAYPAAAMPAVRIPFGLSETSLSPRQRKALASVTSGLIAADQRFTDGRYGLERRRPVVTYQDSIRLILDRIADAIERP